MTGIPKFTCARCGRDFPITYRALQDGTEVCTYTPCLDRPVDHRFV
jgi:hypothetical protein